MKTLAIIGSQWGDEGKGKITDTIGAHADYIVRYQGGNNAGHTIIVNGVKTVLHLIPSGVLHSHCQSVISHGVAFDPQAFLDELSRVQQSVKVDHTNLKISQNCNIITSYHKLLDGLREGHGKIKIGTTGKGIGPCYEDRASRRGIKLSVLMDMDQLKERLEVCLEEKKTLFEKLYQIDYPSIEEEAQRLFELGQKIKPFICDTFSLLAKASDDKKNILYEGAQGVLLDIDFGTYPYVTSSNTSLGGIHTGSFVPSHGVDEILGITKAYTTRVGEGPFPTELSCNIGDTIQKKGNEFGATTGRKRRCGWLDLPLLKYAVRASGMTSIALTKIDVLAQMSDLKVCTGYHYQGHVYREAWPGMDLNLVEPILESVESFPNQFEGELPPTLKAYIRKVEEFLEIPVGVMAYGPDRSEISFLKNYFH